MIDAAATDSSSVILPDWLRMQAPLGLDSRADERVGLFDVQDRKGSAKRKYVAIVAQFRHRAHPSGRPA